MTLEELQEKYYWKTVRVKSFYKLPDVIYIVTAIIDDVCGPGFVFAVRDVNYTLETKRWYTIKADTLEQLEEVASHFEVV